MENMVEWEQNSLVRELTQGREMARQLQIYLNVPCSSSQETREMLVQKIVSSYEKALSMLNWGTNTSTSMLGGAGADQPGSLQPTSGPGGLGIESPPLCGSPHSEDSDRDQDLKDGSKKRKASQRWTHQVTVNPATGLEGTLDDGFSWRKYGQKDILGARYPRGYYRCTHRHVQGCLATKQVQRSDDDPMIFEITYRGRHTCTQAASKTTAISAPFLSTPPENQEPNMTLDPQQKQQQQQHSCSSYQQLLHPQEALLQLKRSLTIATQDLEVHQEPSSVSSLPSSFRFGSASSNTPKADHNQVYSPSVISSTINTYTGSSPSNFMSPATSGTGHFYASPSGIITSFQAANNNNNNNQTQNFQNSDPSELNEIISAAASSSAVNSPTVNVDFPFGNAEFDQNFTFENLGSFSSFHPFEK